MTQTEDNTFVQFFRKIEDWEWYTDANTFRVFFHLILKANHKDTRWRGVEIKRGQRLTSLSNIASELNIGVQSVRTSIKRLKSTGELTSKSTSKYTIIEIKNYDKYQSPNKLANKQLTRSQQATNKQLTINNNVNNVKNVKKEYVEIISRLNEKGNFNYKSNTKKTVSLINARIQEGFTVEDFVTVIDKKIQDWKNNGKMKKYLRPETLFGTKFEGYLNESTEASEEEIVEFWEREGTVAMRKKYFPRWAEADPESIKKVEALMQKYPHLF